MRLLSLALLIVGCQTTDPAQKPLSNQDLEVRGHTFGGTIGVNSDSKLVIRQTIQADDRLATLELTNVWLRTRAERVLYDLDSCQSDLSDRRLGGSGKIPENTIDVSALKTKAPIEQMGTTEAGELVIVTEQGYADKLTGEQKLSVQLKIVADQAEKDLSTCHRELSEARRAHGLPGKAYGPKGYTTQDGVFVSNNHGEQDLDDGFEQSAINATNASKADK